MEKSLTLYRVIEGVQQPFPDSEEPIVLSSFTVRKQRMGSAPAITATVKYKNCLDGQWDGVYVIFGGEKYYVKTAPDSSKNNTDRRYEHSVTFVSERIILDNVYMVDAVRSDDEADSYKSNDTRVVFSGNISQWADRLNAALEHAGLYSSSSGGYRVYVDSGITTEDKLVSFEEKYISEALQEGFKAFGVPYYFNRNNNVMEIRMGFSDNDIDDVIQYGAHDALISIGRKNTNTKNANRMSGYGSSDNLPYYYPNQTPIGNGVESVYTQAEGSTASASVTSINRLASRTGRFPIEYGYGTTGLVDHTGRFLSQAMAFYHDVPDYYYTGADVYMGLNGIIFDTESFVQISAEGLNWEVVEVKIATGTIISTTPISTLSPRFDSFSRIQLRDVMSAQIYDVQTGTIVPPGEYQLGIDAHIQLGTPYNTRDTGIYCYVQGTFNATINVGTWRDAMGKKVSPSDLGVTVTGTPVIGDVITLNAADGWMEPIGRLMPPIYRSSEGAERFYEALNDTYPIPGQTGEYYHFEHEYSDEDRKELIQGFEDIKPTIVGVMNSTGQRMDQFVQFAYDANDNDEKDEDGTYLHPYFFARLPIMNGSSGFNLFDCALDSPMQVAMTSGTCGSCKFEVGVDENSMLNTVQVDANGNLKRDSYGDVMCGRKGKPAVVPQDIQQDTSAASVWIALKKDNNTYPSVMPMAPQDGRSGLRPSTSDTFVLLNIHMPESYIEDAEERLKDAIIRQMVLVNSPIFNPSIDFSRVFLEQNPTFLESLTENSRLTNIVYNNIRYGYYVTQLTYTMSEKEILPEIAVDLSTELVAVQNALDTRLEAMKLDVLSTVGDQRGLIRRIADAQEKIGTVGRYDLPVFFDNSVAKEIGGLKVPGDIQSTSGGVSAKGIADLSMSGGGGGGTSDYNDLENKPSINNVTLSGNKTSSQLGLASTSDIANFVTKSVNDLTYYYTKSQTYTQTEVNNLIGAIQQFHYEIVSTLPVTGQSNVLYLKGPIGSGSDKYEEYVYANSTWTKIGDTSIDLSGYVTTTVLNAALANYTTTEELISLLLGKQDVIGPKGNHSLPVYFDDNSEAETVDSLSVPGNIQSTGGGVSAKGIADLSMSGGGGGGVSDFDDLSGRPYYNGSPMTSSTNIPAVPDPQIQSDWNQTDSSSKDYIKNKPTLGSLASKNNVGTSDIADDAITAAKVKDNETLPVNISGKAPQLTNTRKIWGQDFNGTADVNGDFTTNGNVILNNTKSINIKNPSGSTRNILTLNSAGQVAIAYGSTLNDHTQTLVYGNGIRFRKGDGNADSLGDMSSTGDLSMNGGVSAKGIVDLSMSGGGGSGGGSSFDELSNRPKYAGTTMSSSTDIPAVPTKTSDLTNDSGFLTSHQDISGKMDTDAGNANVRTTNKLISYASKQTEIGPSEWVSAIPNTGTTAYRYTFDTIKNWIRYSRGETVDINVTGSSAKSGALIVESLGTELTGDDLMDVLLPLVADSGWLSAGGGISYRKINKTVYLKGTASVTDSGNPSASPQTICTLPEGYRPGTQFVRYIVCGNGSATCLAQPMINTNGTITSYLIKMDGSGRYSGSMLVCFDGIIFLID